MPVIDAFIDALRAEFGDEEINRAIVEGLADGSFYAREAGHEVGTGARDRRVGIRLDGMWPWNERTR